MPAAGAIQQETRHWHGDKGTTSPGRVRSDADDYRYFPEPDLLPIEPPAALVSRLRSELPEAPAVRRRRLRETWGFTELEFRDVANAGLLVEIEETVGQLSFASENSCSTVGRLRKLLGASACAAR